MQNAKRVRAQENLGRFVKFRQTPRMQKAVDFFYSPLYLYALGLLLLVLHTIGVDALTFGVLLLVGAASLVLCPDALPSLAVLVFLTAAKSIENRNYENFSGVSYAVLGVCGAAMAAALVFHVLVNRSWRNLRGGKLYLGYALLGVGLLVNGFFFPGCDYTGKDGQILHYAATLRNVVSGASLFFTVFGVYFIARGGVRYNGRETVRYFAYLCLVYGMAVSVQLCLAYFMNKPFVESNYDKGLLHTGWGMSNSLGAALFRGIPMAFYLMCTEEKHGWYYFLAATLMAAAMVFTYSRAALLFSAPLYVLCYVLTVVFGKHRRQTLLCGGAMLLGVAAFALLFKSQIYSLIKAMLDHGMRDSGRFAIWTDGKDRFLQNPLFGVGLRYKYKQTEQRAYYYYHNTLVQFVAHGGLIGIGTYLFHRMQTCALFTQKPTLERTFLGILCGGILLISLLDVQYVHFAAQTILCPAFVLAEHDLSRALPLCRRRRAGQCLY